MVARRQHYVWQKYLEPWTTRKGKANQIWCQRRGQGAPYLTETANVAVEKDFYRLHGFEPSDAAFIRAMAFRKETNPVLRKLNERWITGIERIFTLHNAVKAIPDLSSEQLWLLEQQLIQYQENAYSRIEDQAIALMPDLQAGQTGFFSDLDKAIRFCNFLAHQYFRTKAVRDRTRAGFTGEREQQLFDRIWPALRFIFATNVAYALLSDRGTAPLRILRAPPGVRFITTDQPAINIQGAFAPAGTLVEELDLYYPVSPQFAVLISANPEYNGLSDGVLEESRIRHLNHAMALVAHEQVFAATEAELGAAGLG